MWNENEKDNDYDVVILLSIYTSTMKFIKKKYQHKSIQN